MTQIKVMVVNPQLDLTHVVEGLVEKLDGIKDCARLLAHELEGELGESAAQAIYEQLGECSSLAARVEELAPVVRP